MYSREVAELVKTNQFTVYDFLHNNANKVFTIDEIFLGIAAKTKSGELVPAMSMGQLKEQCKRLMWERQIDYFYIGGKLHYGVRLNEGY